MAAINTVGAATPLGLAIAFFDQHGNPMATAPTPDSPPTWSNTNPASETLTVAADGLTASATAVAAGVDTVTMTAIVGGNSFSANIDVTVSALVQVVTSAQIVVTGGGV